MARPVLSAAGQVLRHAARRVDEPDVTAVVAEQEVVLVERRVRARSLENVCEPTAVRRQRDLTELLEPHEVIDRQGRLAGPRCGLGVHGARRSALPGDDPVPARILESRMSRKALLLDWGEVLVSAERDGTGVRRVEIVDHEPERAGVLAM